MTCYTADHPAGHRHPAAKSKKSAGFPTATATGCPPSTRSSSTTYTRSASCIDASSRRTGLERYAARFSADVVVIGAGIVGAAAAAVLAATGRRVLVVDRSGPLGGTTAAGEGNILVSDKLPGPELDLALRSVALWQEVAAEASEVDGSIEVSGVSGVFGVSEFGFEFESKGGVVVAHDEAQLAALLALGERQRAAGVEVTALDPDGLREAEPRIAPGWPGAPSTRRTAR